MSFEPTPRAPQGYPYPPSLATTETCLARCRAYDFARRALKATNVTVAAPTPHFAAGWVSNQVT